MAGPVSDRNSLPRRINKNTSKAQYDINGMSRPCGITFRGPRAQVSEDIITEGERQLQELLKKQMNTKVSAEQLLRKQKEFSGSAVSQPVFNEVSGTITLDDYDRRVKDSEEVEELRQAGLTEEEIEIKLQYQSSHFSSSKDKPCQNKKARYGVDPLVMTERIGEINKKIEDHRNKLSRPTTFADAKVMLRQEMDLELAITKNRDKTRKFTHLVTGCLKSGAIDPSHPINHVNDILKELSSKSCYKRSLPDCSIPYFKKEQGNIIKNRSKSESSEDSESDESIIRENFDVPNKPDGWGKNPEAQPKVLLPDGTRNTLGDIESISEDVIQRYRLTVEQIRSLPRFKDYDPGEPNRTLYVKNLSSRVSEADLISLFFQFQKPNEPKIVFRLLSGRMRGQAFISFPSVETAQAALGLVNGYNFKGKPIIIQYGRQRC